MTSTIESLLARAPDAWNDAVALGAIGRELHDRNRLDHARRFLERALELDPQQVECWAHLAYCGFRSFREQEGLDVLRRGIEATGSIRLKGALSHFLGEGQELEALKEEIAASEDLGAQASTLAHRFYAGEADAALDGLRQLMRSHPASRIPAEQFLWSVFGGAHRGLVDDEVIRREAVAVADRWIRRAPAAVFAYWMKQQLLAAQKDWEGVLDATVEGLAVFPDEETMMRMRGQALEQLGRDDEALQWYARAVGAKPSFVGARVALGKLYEKMGKPELAEVVFREIPVANPDYTIGRVSLALFLGRQDRWEEAERIFLDAWAELPPFLRDAARRSPDAGDLLEREAIRAVVEA